MMAYLPETRLVVPVKTPGDALSFALHSERRVLVRGHRFSDTFDLTSLQPSEQVLGRSDASSPCAPGVAFVDERFPAPLHRRHDLRAEAGLNKRRAIGGDEFAVEPGRAIGVDLSFEVETGEDA